MWALTIYDTKHSCFRLLGVICRLFSHWKYIFDVLCRAKNQTPGTRVKSVARFFVHVAERRTLSRTSLAVFIFLTFAGCCGTSSVSRLAAPNSRANIPRTLSCKCSDKHCDFNGAGFFLRITIAGDNSLHKGQREGSQLIKESICPHKILLNLNPSRQSKGRRHRPTPEQCNNDC